VLNKVAGIQLVNVPYRGVAPAFNDLLGGHVPVAIVSLATALQHIQTGRVRLLTVFDTKALCQGTGRADDLGGAAGLSARPVPGWGS